MSDESRYYVISTTGWFINPENLGQKRGHPNTTFAVLDRVYCHREVFTSRNNRRVTERMAAKYNEWDEIDTGVRPAAAKCVHGHPLTPSNRIAKRSTSGVECHECLIHRRRAIRPSEAKSA